MFHETVGDAKIVNVSGLECIRDYGKCKRLIDVPQHIDVWIGLFKKYGKELEHAVDVTGGMFLELIPAELKTEITKDLKLTNSTHQELAAWCKARVKVLQNEALVDINRKAIQRESKRRIHSLQGPAHEEIADVPEAIDPVTAELKKVSEGMSSMMNAFQKKPNADR
jgi:hypothetical protein